MTNGKMNYAEAELTDANRKAEHHENLEIDCSFASTVEIYIVKHPYTAYILEFNGIQGP